MKRHVYGADAKNTDLAATLGNLGVVYRQKINVELWCQCGKDKGDVRRVLSLLKGGADPNRPYAVSYRVIYVYISKLYTYQVSLASSLGWLYIFTYGSISWSPQSNTIPLEGWFEDRCAK